MHLLFYAPKIPHLPSPILTKSPGVISKLSMASLQIREPISGLSVTNVEISSVKPGSKLRRASNVPCHLVSTDKARPLVHARRFMRVNTYCGHFAMQPHPIVIGRCDSII